MRILIVEDQPLLALDLEQNVLDEGHRVIGIAATMPQALTLARVGRPDLAFVDVQLADGITGIAVAEKIAASGLKVVFVTATPHLLPADGAGAMGVLDKPCAVSALRQTLAYIAHSLNSRERVEAPHALRTFAAG